MDTDSADNTTGPYREAFGLHPKYQQAKKNYRSDDQLDRLKNELIQVEPLCPIGRIPRFNRRSGLTKKEFLEGDLRKWKHCNWDKSYVRNLQGFKERVLPERVFLDHVSNLRMAYFEIFGLIEHAKSYGTMCKSTVQLIKRFAFGFCHDKYVNAPGGPETILSYRLRCEVFQFLRRTTVYNG